MQEDPKGLKDAPQLLSYGRGHQQSLAKKIAILGLGSILAAVAGACLPIAGTRIQGLWVLAAWASQGIAIGMILMFAIRQAEFRAKKPVVAIAIASAIFSVLLFWLFLYVRDVSALAVLVVRSSGQATAIFHYGIRRSFELYDNVVLIPRFNIGGFPGFLILKNQLAPHFFALAIGHAFFTAFMAVFMASREARKPFCPCCGSWTPVGRNAAVLPARFFEALRFAVKSHDAEEVVKVIHSAAGEPMYASCAVARIIKCPGCSSTLADVVMTGTTKATPLLPIPISEEFALALKADPVMKVQTEEENPIEEPEPFAGSDSDVKEQL